MIFFVVIFLAGTVYHPNFFRSVNCVDTAIQDIKALCTENFTLDNADNELTCMAMICALPADYLSFVSSLILLKKLDKAKLQDTFITKESNHQPHPTIKSPITLQASSLSAPSEKTCIFCKSTNHLMDTCYAFDRMSQVAVKEHKEK